MQKIENWTCPICQKQDSSCYLHWKHVEENHNEYFQKTFPKDNTKE